MIHTKHRSRSLLTAAERVIFTITGASVDGYYLAAQYSAAVQPPFNGLTLLSGEAAASASALAATFSFVLPTTYNASALDFIYAYGPLSADGSVAQHAVRSLHPARAVPSARSETRTQCYVEVLPLSTPPHQCGFCLFARNRPKCTAIKHKAPSRLLGTPLDQDVLHTR